MRISGRNATGSVAPSKGLPVPHFIDATTYADLIDALLKLAPDPFTDRIEADQVKIILGERGDIWPTTIKADTTAN